MIWGEKVWNLETREMLWTLNPHVHTSYQSLLACFVDSMFSNSIMCYQSPHPGRCSIINHITGIRSKSKLPLLDGAPVPIQGRDIQKIPLSQKSRMASVFELGTLKLATSTFSPHSVIPLHHTLWFPPAVSVKWKASHLVEEISGYKKQDGRVLGWW